MYREQQALKRIRNFIYSVLALTILYQAGESTNKLTDDPANRLLAMTFSFSLEDLKHICEQEYCRD